MPAKSKKQQMAAGAAERGEAPKSSLKGASKSMAASMTEKDLEKLASTKRKNLPKKCSEVVESVLSHLDEAEDRL